MVHGTRQSALGSRARFINRTAGFDEEGLDILAPDVGHSARAMAARLGKEGVELLDRLGVRDDR